MCNKHQNYTIRIQTGTYLQTKLTAGQTWISALKPLTRYKKQQKSYSISRMSRKDQNAEIQYINTPLEIILAAKRRAKADEVTIWRVNQYRINYATSSNSNSKKCATIKSSGKPTITIPPLRTETTNTGQLWKSPTINRNLYSNTGYPRSRHIG